MSLSFIARSALGLTLTAGLLAGFTYKTAKQPAKPVCYLSAEESADGSRTVYTLDKTNRLIRTASYGPEGREKNRYSFTYGTSGKITEDEFYSLGGEPDETVIMGVKYIYSDSRISATKQYEKIGDGPTDQISFAKYTYNDKGLVSQMTVYAHSTSDVPLTGYTYEYDEAGNMIRTSAYEYLDADTTLDWTYECTYDDKPNPKAAFRLPGLPDNGTTVNNVLSETKKNRNGAVVYSVSYTYEYNSNNLPSKRTATTAGRPRPEVTIFTYKCP